MKQRVPAWKPSEPVHLNARRVLPELLRDYYASGRKLGDDSDPRDMHAFRLKTKHLRYTLEAFTSLYGPGLKQKTDRLRPIQNALGELNDCQVLLAELGNRLTHAVRNHIHRRAGGKRGEFLRYWREEFDAADEDKKWEQYLTRSARVRQPR